MNDNTPRIGSLEEISNLLSSVPNVWQVTSIDNEPEVKLARWSIKKMKEGNFFVGDHIGHSGRVSTKIVQFDEEKKRGITESGRVYELVGAEGYSSNGEYVWEYYKKINGLTDL